VVLERSEPGYGRVAQTAECGRPRPRQCPNGVVPSNFETTFGPGPCIWATRPYLGCQETLEEFSWASEAGACDRLLLNRARGTARLPGTWRRLNAAGYWRRHSRRLPTPHDHHGRRADDARDVDPRLQRMRIVCQTQSYFDEFWNLIGKRPL